MQGLIAATAAGAFGTLGCDEDENTNKQSLQDLLTDTKTLKEFPYFLSENGVFNGYIIVGDNAPASDVIAATDIATGMQTAGVNISTNTTKLASEIPNLDKNAILIGRAYDNPLIYPGEVPGLAAGEGYLGLQKQNGLYRLVVSGVQPVDIRKAGRILSEHCKDPSKYDLHGKKVIVTGTSLEDLAITVLG